MPDSRSDVRGGRPVSSSRHGITLTLSVLAWCISSATTLTQAQQSDVAGTYRAWLDCPGGELPFGLELTRDGEAWSGAWRNGPESIPIPQVTWDGEALTLDMPHYDSSITARARRDGTLIGTWRKRGAGANSWSMLPFHATPGASPRFPKRNDPSHDFAERYAVQFESSDDSAVLLLSGSPEARVATFLTTTGDYRYLAGDSPGDQLRLSCFDGAHAFLFTARRGEDGRLEGDFWSRDSWHETWTATPAPEAALPDAFGLTRVEEDVDWSSLSYPDLDGDIRRLDDPAFAGKARLIYVFGTWCPNCTDCTAYLRELRTKYGAQGLSVLGLAFEHTGDFERDARQLRVYRKEQDVDWPLLLAGVSNKTKASESFPALDRVRSYPTTMFVDHRGVVRAVHQGFTGPATGEAYTTLRTRFETLIESMLDEAGGR